MSFFIIFNIIFCVLCWHWATEHFKEGNNAHGYMDLFLSALNAVVVVNYFV